MSLIDEAKKKDPDAFGQLVQENLQKMYRGADCRSIGIIDLFLRERNCQFFG